jgi:DNA-binding NtrC family response regulator
LSDNQFPVLARIYWFGNDNCDILGRKGEVNPAGSGETQSRGLRLSNMITTRKRSVLLAGHHRYSLELLRNALSEWGYLVIEAQTARELIAALGEPSLVIADLTTLGLQAPNLLVTINYFRPGIPVILVHDYPTLNEAMAAVKAGAEDFFTQPVDYARLKLVVERSLASRQGLSDEEDSGDELQETYSTFRFR